ncbi:hypothetical protein ABGB18_31785 [Nonomuraea sp. B12E4]|uniref:WD40 repeat domain-containing protein n=1 Tax=Nonomuraea sp. B12E4 TaxID=3153564 RepID=UPI00325F2A39
MITSAQIPTGSPIRDFSVVHHAGQTLIVCAEKWGQVLTWAPATGEWMPRPLPYAHAEDPSMAKFPDAANVIDMVGALSADGRLLLAAGGDEQEPALWDLDSGELLWRTPFNGAYLADVIAVDGAFVTAQQYSEEVRLWSPDGTDTVLGQVSSPFCLAATRVDGRRLILAGGSEAEVWDAGTLAHLGYFAPEEGRVWAVTACALAGRPVVVGGTEEGELYVWPLDAQPDGLPLYEPVAASDGPLEAAVMTPGGRPVVVTADQGALRLWDAADGTEAGRVGAHDVTAMEPAIVDGRQVLVTSGADGVLRIWDESDLTP